MKRIPLKNGRFAIVDDEDFERISQWKWQLWRHPRWPNNVRVTRGIYFKDTPSRRGIVRMEHQVLNVAGRELSVQIDHKNGDPLDNRKANLRFCTASENSCNRRKMPGCKFPYKGVYQPKECVSFFARIFKEGKRIDLGRHETIIDAARAYDEAAKKYHGEFARLNFN